MITQHDLDNRFHGSENAHEFWQNTLLSNGAAYLANNGLHHVLTDIASVQQLLQAEHGSLADMQFWTLTVAPDKTAQLVCDDGDDNILYTQSYSRSACPLPKVDIMCQKDGTRGGQMVIFLPSEN